MHLAASPVPWSPPIDIDWAKSDFFANILCYKSPQKIWWNDTSGLKPAISADLKGIILCFVSFIFYFNMEVTKCTVTYFSFTLLLFCCARDHHITKGTKLLPSNDLSIIKLFIALFFQMSTYIIIHNQIDQKWNAIQFCTTSLF